MNALIEEDLFTSLGGGPVGGLDDEFGLDSVSVIDVDGLLESSRNQKVTNSIQLYHFSYIAASSANCCPFFPFAFRKPVTPSFSLLYRKSSSGLTPSSQ